MPPSKILWNVLTPDGLPHDIPFDRKILFVFKNSDGTEHLGYSEWYRVSDLARARATHWANILLPEENGYP